MNAVNAVSTSTHSWYLGRYVGDPETDSAATMFSACNVSGSPYVTTTALRTTGVKTIDLGATAVSDFQSAYGLGSTFSIACRIVDESSAPTYGTEIDDYDQTDPPELCVTYMTGGVMLTPSAVTIPIVTAAPAMNRIRRVTPSPATVPLVAPAPSIARLRTLSPSPAAVPILTAAPALLRPRLVTPAATTIPVVAPTPTVGTGGGPRTLTPSPAAVPILTAAPAILRPKVLTPAALAVPITVPAATFLRTLALAPGPVSVQIVAAVPTVNRLRTLLPGAVAVPILAPAPALVRALALRPGAVAVTLVIPTPAVQGGTGGAATILDPITHRGIVPWPRT